MKQAQQKKIIAPQGQQIVEQYGDYKVIHTRDGRFVSRKIRR